MVWLVGLTDYEFNQSNASNLNIRSIDNTFLNSTCVECV